MKKFFLKKWGWGWGIHIFEPFYHKLLGFMSVMDIIPTTIWLIYAVYRAFTHLGRLLPRISFSARQLAREKRKKGNDLHEGVKIRISKPFFSHFLTISLI